MHAGLDRRTFLRASGFAGIMGFPGVVAASPGRDPGPKPTEWLVGVSVGAGPRSAVTSCLSGNCNVTHENDTLGYAAVELSEQSHESLSQAVESTGPIKYIEPNERYHAQFVPNDPSYDQQYVTEEINAKRAWEETLGSHDVTIAVVDEGVKYDHPDLEGNMADDPGRDIVDSDSDPTPDDLSAEAHGTHVAGIAGARVDNSTGISGISNSTLLSVRALNESGGGSASDIADAIEWAVDQGADVINLSLSGPAGTQTLQNAVSYAAAHDVLVVAAAGNQGRSEVNYPAAYSDCVAVSALNPDGSLPNYSNYGEAIELAAPGTNVVSTWTDDGYASMSGTSMAAPVVSGVAGLTLAKWDLSPEALRSHLRNTASDVGLSEEKQGAGRVDAGATLTTRPDQKNSQESNGKEKSTSTDDGDSGKTSSRTRTEAIETTVDGTLSGPHDREYFSYAWASDSPNTLVLTLDGPSDADFDIYAATNTDSVPTTDDYDYASKASNSHERITIDDPGHSTELYVLVDDYSGNGDYTLTFAEYA